MASTLRERLAHAAKITGWVTTMPWVCLQAPIEQILQEQNPVVQEKQLIEWRTKKNSELEHVSFAVSDPSSTPRPESSSSTLTSLSQGTLIASAVTGSIQWSSLSTAHWVVSAVWYSTLLFSLVSVVMAFYLSILFSNFAIHNNGTNILLAVLHKTRNAEKSRWASLFALQMPIMFLSYALILYILGLSLMVIRPLWNAPWGNSSWVSVISLNILEIKQCNIN